jgi:hypothetical protein
MKSFHMSQRLRKLLIGAAIAAVAVILFWLLAQIGIGIPCLFYRITGFQCPGCGNSRAALALLRLDFAAAFGYNPLCFLEFFYIGWVLFHCARAYLKGSAFTYRPPYLWMDILILAAVLLWWPLRNLI